MSTKRKNESTEGDSAKKLKLASGSAAPRSIKVPKSSNHVSDPENLNTARSLTGVKGKQKETNSTEVSSGSVQEALGTAPNRQPRRNKLAPPRPFSTVPASVSATGPRSSQKEGKNLICITRKTALGAYMRRCKEVFIKDGYKTLHLSAMGAAIPLLLQLTCVLPSILPYSRDEIHTQVMTSTIELHDEIIPEDDDEDIIYKTRSKSTLSVILKIGTGEGERQRGVPEKDLGGKRVVRPSSDKNGHDQKSMDKERAAKFSEVVYQEPEQEAPDAI